VPFQPPIWPLWKSFTFLDLVARQLHTPLMPHIYIQFDFAKDEEKAQQARHKLEGWKQAFRLDKKLLYKFERTAANSSGDGSGNEKSAKPEKSEEVKGKSKAKSEDSPPDSNETVKLFVRLAFSTHEKLSEQRWVERIPLEEPFQAASPAVVKSGDARFSHIEKQFEDLA
jgi:hypothetical protein